MNVDWDGNELLLSDILGTEEDTIYRDLEYEAEKKCFLKLWEGYQEENRRSFRCVLVLEQQTEKNGRRKEVADTLGISQSYISRLEKKIMIRLRRELVKYS